MVGSPGGGNSWGSEENLRVGGFVLQTVYSQWELGGGGESGRGPLGWGRGMANLVSPYQLEGKGAWVRCVPPIHSSPGGRGVRSQVRLPFGGRREG